MPVDMRDQMLREAALAARFADVYRRQFAAFVDRLNQNADQPVERDGLRLCIEAVDMMLTMQTYLTRTIAQLGSTTEPVSKAA